jgi:uncharacterized membrane protein required for colicin V production
LNTSIFRGFSGECVGFAGIACSIFCISSADTAAHETFAASDKHHTMSNTVLIAFDLLLIFDPFPFE